MKIPYIDLFCGGGGLGEGFKQAGYESAFHIDADYWAMETVKLRECYHYLKKVEKLNLYYNYLKNSPGPYTSEKLSNKYSSLMDILTEKTYQGKISDENITTIINRIKSSVAGNHKTVIIGGPPCQAYSVAKRSRMRKPLDNVSEQEIKSAEEENKNRIKKHLSDERHGLYALYLKIIYELKPAAFVYENVPGILTAKSNDGDIINLLSQDLNQRAGGYELISLDLPPPKKMFYENDVRRFKEFIVNASDYGVPQNRKRFILIGVKSNLKKSSGLDIRKIFNDAVSGFKTVHKLTVKNAISDLPHINHNSGNNFFLEKPYNDNENDYSLTLSCPDLHGILNHFSRKHMEADLKRYKYFAEFAKNAERNATLYDLVEDNKDLMPKHKSAEDVSRKNRGNGNNAGYVDRFKVQMWDKPSSTITAHISKDGHAFIHPDPSQNRSLTVRETARLQSFPDDYAFCGPRTEQFRQVGNAVPVKLAKVIATGIKKVLGNCHD